MYVYIYIYIYIYICIYRCVVYVYIYYILKDDPSLYTLIKQILFTF